MASAAVTTAAFTAAPLPPHPKSHAPSARLPPLPPTVAAPPRWVEDAWSASPPPVPDIPSDGRRADRASRRRAVRQAPPRGTPCGGGESGALRASPASCLAAAQRERALAVAASDRAFDDAVAQATAALAAADAAAAAASTAAVTFTAGGWVETAAPTAPTAPTTAPGAAALCRGDPTGRAAVEQVAASAAEPGLQATAKRVVLSRRNAMARLAADRVATAALPPAGRRRPSVPADVAGACGSPSLVAPRRPSAGTKSTASPAGVRGTTEAAGTGRQPMAKRFVPRRRDTMPRPAADRVAGAAPPPAGRRPPSVAAGVVGVGASPCFVAPRRRPSVGTKSVPAPVPAAAVVEGMATPEACGRRQLRAAAAGGSCPRRWRGALRGVATAAAGLAIRSALAALVRTRRSDS